MFADDSCLIFSADNLDELQITINRELGKVDEWMASNKLTLNYSKTKFMLVHRKNEQPLLNLYIKNHKIEHLGVRITA